MDDEALARRDTSVVLAGVSSAVLAAMQAQTSPIVETMRLSTESPATATIKALVEQAELTKKLYAKVVLDLTPTIASLQSLSSVAAAFDPLRETSLRLQTETSPLVDAALAAPSQLGALYEAGAVGGTSFAQIASALSLAQMASIQLLVSLASYANVALDGWSRTLDAAVVSPPRSARSLEWLGGTTLEVAEIASDFATLDDTEDEPGPDLPEQPWREGCRQLTDELTAWLSDACPRAATHLNGAWFVLVSNGPAAASQAAHSGVEALDWTLRTLAPETEMLAWREQAGAHKDDLDPGSGRPTRSLRVRYITRDHGLDSGSVVMIVGAVASVMRELQRRSTVPTP